MKSEVRSQLSNQNIQCDIDDQAIDLWKYIHVLKKRFWIIALLTVLAVTASGLLSYYVMTPVYQARTVLLVTQAAEKPQVTGQMSTYVGQVKSETLMQRVINKLHLDQLGYTPSSLAGQIKATAARDSYLIEVTVSNRDPILAADIANTLSQEFSALISENNAEVMENSVKYLRDQIETIRGELAAATDPSEQKRLQGVLTLLVEGIAKTQIARSVDMGNTGLAVISPAIVPKGPVKPNIKLNIVVALMLGLMTSGALIFVLESLDNTRKTPDDVVAKGPTQLSGRPST